VDAFGRHGFKALVKLRDGLAGAPLAAIADELDGTSAIIAALQVRIRIECTGRARFNFERALMYRSSTAETR
jgi:hypothetical protein